MKRKIRDIKVKLVLIARYFKAIFLKRRLYRLDNVHRLNSLFVKEEKSKLFILGSGDSINRLSKENWSEIRENYSMGLNNWILHDFVPNLISIELPKNHLDKVGMINNINARKSDYENTKIIFKDLKINDLIAKTFEANFAEIDYYLPQDLIVPSNNQTELRRDLISLDKSWFINKFMPELLLKKRASISMLIYLGYKMGFENIILCGVDLNGSDYFFEANKVFYRDKGYYVPEEKPYISKVHKTADENYGQLTIDKVIEEMNETLLKNRGIHLFTAFSDSKLSEILDVYYT